MHKYHFLIKRNATFCAKVDETGIGETGVGEQVSLKYSVNWLFVQEPAEKPLLKGSVCWQF